MQDSMIKILGILTVAVLAPLFAWLMLPALVTVGAFCLLAAPFAVALIAFRRAAPVAALQGDAALAIDGGDDSGAVSGSRQAA